MVARQVCEYICTHLTSKIYSFFFVTAGWYQSEEAQPICIRCPANNYTDQPKQTWCKGCDDKQNSNIGSTFCTACDAGQYMLNRHCSTCPDGWTSIYGESKCDECTQGKFVNGLVCASCGPGTYGAPNLEAKERTSADVACHACPRGTYSSAKGVANATDCNECPPGKASSQTGNKKPNDCNDCSPNT